MIQNPIIIKSGKEPNIFDITVVDPVNGASFYLYTQAEKGITWREWADDNRFNHNIDYGTQIKVLPSSDGTEEIIGWRVSETGGCHNWVKIYFNDDYSNSFNVNPDWLIDPNQKYFFYQD